jgi:hypothetical protein
MTDLADAQDGADVPHLIDAPLTRLNLINSAEDVLDGRANADHARCLAIAQAVSQTSGCCARLSEPADFRKARQIPRRKPDP